MNEGLKVIKVQSKKTYKDKKGVEHHYYNFYLESANGKRIAIRCVNNADFARLDMIAIYVG